MSLPSKTLDPAVPEPARSWSAWRWWLPPALLALTLAFLCRDPFAGDWDSLDYTILALKGEPSTMLLGRMLFIFTNHWLWQVAHAVFGLSPEKAYLLFKYAVIVETPLTVVACWTLTRDLTSDRRTATIAALLLALSPFFVIYSGQAMTEIPSLLLLAMALTVYLRGVRRRKLWLMFLGAALLGLEVNVREAMGIYGLWLVCAPFVCGWKLKGRDVGVIALACVIFFGCAFGPFAYWYLMNVGGYRAGWHVWLASMRMESALHPVTIGNSLPLLTLFFLAIPIVFVTLPVAAYREWKERGLSLLLVLGSIGLLANLALITTYSAVINGRYMLSGIIGLVPLTAAYLMRYETKKTGSVGRAFLRVVGGVLLIGIIMGVEFYPYAGPTIKGHGRTKEYRARLALLPDDAVVMAGGQTVSVTFWRGVGAGRWDVIGTGGGWPGAQLVEIIENYLRDGRRVFLDADPQQWATNGWQLDETRAIVALESRYHFRRISDTIFEIRPLADETAHDAPHLQQRLLQKPT